MDECRSVLAARQQARASRDFVKSEEVITALPPVLAHYTYKNPQVL
jgi:hypothetical protein